jgi:predicted transcriptional regulator
MLINKKLFVIILLIFLVFSCNEKYDVEKINKEEVIEINKKESVTKSIKSIEKMDFIDLSNSLYSLE